MDSTAFRKALADVGLSQTTAADFLGVNDRTIRRWALGESALPTPVAKLLRLMVRLRLKAGEVK